MIVIVKKGAFAAAAAAAACLFLLCLVLSHASAAVSSPGLCTVVIDAGHGGVDPGVVGVSGSKESEINLSIAKSLGDRFTESGFRVVYTRKDEGGLYGAFTPGFKKRDMQKRRQIIEDAVPAAVISVHQNSYPSDPSRRGGQVFYRADSADARALAEHIQARLNALSGKGHAALAGDYYILNCTAYPSVIVECGFLSNAEEEALLRGEDYREALARAVFAGVLSYLA